MLLGRGNINNRNPIRTLAGTNGASGVATQYQAQRCTFGMNGAMRNMYYGDYSNLPTAANVIISTHIPFGQSIPSSSYPPYVCMPAQKAGGFMSIRLLGGDPVTFSLIPQALASVAMTGTGALATTIYCVGNIISALTGNGTLTTVVTPQGNIVLSAIGNGTVSADITGAGNVTLNLSGIGTLSATAIQFINMICNMIGSGTLTTDMIAVLNMVCSLTGGSTVTASITGQYPMSSSMTGTGNFAADINAFANMLVELLGQGDLDLDMGGMIGMSIDINVTGTGLTTSNVGAAVWQSILADFDANPDSAAAKLLAAGDPWATILPAGYTDEQAGKILADIKAIVKFIKTLDLSK